MIDLPQSDIRSKLDELIEVANFERDEVLIEYLRTLYLSIKESKRQSGIATGTGTGIGRGTIQLSFSELNSNVNFTHQCPQVLSEV